MGKNPKELADENKKLQGMLEPLQDENEFLKAKLKDLNNEN